MSDSSTSLTIGLDLGDKMNTYHVLDDDGETVASGQVANRHAAMRGFFRQYAGARVAMETGTHSPWVSRLAEEEALTVLVGHSRKLRAIYQNPGKCDQTDAQMLARIARFDPALLHPIAHRGALAQADLAMLKARDLLVSLRSTLISHLRSQVKTVGERLPSCSAAAFASRAGEALPDALAPALAPLVEPVGELTRRIRAYDRQLAALAAERYPETTTLQQIRGVGPISSLAFVLTVEQPDRFADPRDVGAWLGLTPRRDQSGDTDRQLGISKAGNLYVRRLLVEDARYILGPFGTDCQLRRFGLRLMGLPPTATRDQLRACSRHSKNRAAVAVARKLAVLLLTLWRRGGTYQALPAAAA